MPIKIPDKLPAREILENENIFVMTEQRATTQDIRPLKIAILNLMPTKIETETQLLRLLGNSPLQVEPEFLQTGSYRAKHTAIEHLMSFYKTFDDVKDLRFDGLIITGAPVEMMAFEDVDYWDELCRIFRWSRTNVFSTFHICWGAQAGLYYHYGVPKYTVPEKVFGVFEHTIHKPKHMLLRGFDEYFYAPHSRHTETRMEDVRNVSQLEILASSAKAGLYIAAAYGGRQVFVTGHSEYDKDTLAKEYFRDLDKGLQIKIPEHYFIDDDPSKGPVQAWKAHANLLYVNWLNYVYQTTPYDLGQLEALPESYFINR